MHNKWKAMARILKVLGNIIFIFMLLVMSVLVFFLVQSKLAGKPPAVAGYQMFIVISGSMSPSFDTGSVVFVRPQDPKEIAVGDIITFKGSGGSDSLTTHRVVDVHKEDGLGFTTRGDANNVNDPSVLPAENVVGKVVLAIPYVGYLFNYVQTREGLMALILIPAVLVIFIELYKLFNYARQIDKQEESTGKRKKELAPEAHQEVLGNVLPAVSREDEAIVENTLAKKKIAVVVNETFAAAEPAVSNKAEVIDETDAKTDVSMIIGDTATLKEDIVEFAVIDDLELEVPEMNDTEKEQSAAVAYIFDQSVNHFENEASRENIWEERAFAILSGQSVIFDDNGEEKVWKERAFAMLSGLSVFIDDTGKKEVS